MTGFSSSGFSGVGFSVLFDGGGTQKPGSGLSQEHSTAIRSGSRRVVRCFIMMVLSYVRKFSFESLLTMRNLRYILLVMR